MMVANPVFYIGDSYSENDLNITKTTIFLFISISLLDGASQLFHDVSFFTQNSSTVNISYGHGNIIS